MKLFMTALLATGLTGPMFADQTADARLQSATDVITNMTSASDKSIPQDLIDKAHCIIVIPNLKKGGFIVGAQYGAGFVSCRKKSGTGWTAPASVKSEGGKFGFLIGGAETDVVALVMSEDGVKHLLQSKFTVGAEASAAAGPVGRNATAETDAQLHAEILSYSRQRGIYGGISLNGATLREDDAANKQLYGKDMKNREILSGDASIPAAAEGFVQALDKVSPGK